MNIDEIYITVKNKDYDLYRDVIERANIFSINNNLTLKQGADLEESFMKAAYQDIIKGRIK
jgi:hypothetical protein